MKRSKPLHNVVKIDASLLERELSERRARLQRSEADIRHRFQQYAEEKACVAVLEKALAEVHKLL